MVYVSTLWTANSTLGQGQIAGQMPAQTYYLLRARDTACVSPTYVEWVSLTIDEQGFPGVFPCGGPLGDLAVIASWVK